MPPIPIYTDAPISAAKADGVTPQTKYAPTPTSSTGAQPRTAAGPAQTTQSSQTQNSPPAPQPGAVPTAPIQTPTHAQAQVTSPPAPQPSTTATVTAMPPQMGIPPPTTNAAPTHSTSSTATRGAGSGPTTISLGVVPPSSTSQYAAPAAPAHSPHQFLDSHPPGYVQDPYASELSAAQRASLEAQESADRPTARNSISGILGGGDRDTFGAGGGGGSATTTAGSVWGNVKGIATSVGQKAVELEETAWKKVNGK